MFAVANRFALYEHHGCISLEPKWNRAQSMDSGEREPVQYRLFIVIDDLIQKTVQNSCKKIYKFAERHESDPCQCTVFAFNTCASFHTDTDTGRANMALRGEKYQHQNARTKKETDPIDFFTWDHHDFSHNHKTLIFTSASIVRCRPINPIIFEFNLIVKLQWKIIVNPYLFTPVCHEHNHKRKCTHFDFISGHRQNIGLARLYNFIVRFSFCQLQIRTLKHRKHNGMKWPELMAGVGCPS